MTATRKSTAAPTAALDPDPDPGRPPRIRHPWTRQAVADSQRARLLDAVAMVVARGGFGAGTVAGVIAEAGVSRRTFYEQFDNFEACFLAAYDDGMHTLFGAIREAVARESSDDWRVRNRVAVSAYLRALASRPAAAWAFTIEAMGAGRAVLDRRAWVLEQWVAWWRALHAHRRRTEPGVPAVPDELLLALVGGVEELVRDGLRRRGAEHLPELDSAVRAFVLKVLAPDARN